MHNVVATRLARVIARLHGRDETDPWFLTCQLVLGATFSLRRAAALFPPRDPDLSGQTRALAQSLASGATPADVTFPTWTLGFYLNSAELRLQAAMHRLLRVYTGADGKAFDLARQILPDLGQTTPDVAARQVLESFLEEGYPADTSPSPLRRVWWRANALKHREGHDPSFLMRFEPRFNDILAGTMALIDVVEALAIHRAQLDAA